MRPPPRRAFVARFYRVFVPLVFMVAIGASIVAWALVDARIERLGAHSGLAAASAANSLGTSLTIAVGHVTGVAAEPPVRALFEAPDDPAAQAAAAAAFTTLLTRNAPYVQARWIDELGLERLRVERAPDGSVRRDTEDELQDKSSRDYFRDALAQPPGTVMLSRLDLNVERGVVQVPWVPTVRVVIRVADRGRIPCGIVVINIDMRPQFAAFREHGAREGVELAILNSAGEWLLGPDPADEFTFMFDRAVNLGQRRPALWRQIEADSEGRRVDDGVWVWTRIDPVADARVVAGRLNRTPWIILAREGPGALWGLYARVLGPTALISLLLLALFGYLSWRLAREQHQLGVARDEAELVARSQLLASEIAAAANAANSVDDMIYLCLAPLCRATGIGVTVAQIGDELGMHYIAAADDPEAVGAALCALETSAWLRALRHATAPQWLDLRDVTRSEPEGDVWRGDLHRAGIDGLLGIPLVVDGEPIAGCVLLYDGSTAQRKQTLAAIVDAAWASFAAHVTLVISRQRASEAIERARVAAEEASRVRTAFVATVSHELRTPMNAVIGMTNLLAGTELDDAQQEFVGTIRTSGTHLLAIINDILDFSKIDAGAVEFERYAFAPRQCAEEVVELLGALAAKKRIELLLDVSPEVPARVMGDAGRIRQVLLNLVSNAVKFTEVGEVVVTVTARAIRDGWTELGVAVADTGPGIPAHRMERLFKPFGQAETSTARQHGGTGLGLVISRQLAERMGGTVTARSEPGAGSTFTFTAQLEVVAAAPAPPTYLSGKRALIVDDNAASRRILARCCASWGMEPAAVASAAEAQEAVAAAAFDVVLVDAELAGESGVELARAWAAAGRGAPLVLLSAPGLPLEGEDARLIASRVSKPVRESQLREGVEGALRVRYVASERRLSGPLPTRPRQQLRVLLVDDHPINLRVAGLLLGKLDISADTASDGEEALAAVRRQPYDVVLMDVQMPRMDGLDATRHIHGLFPDAEERPYIIGLTAFATAADRARCFAAGMDDYVQKPIDIDALTAALGRAATRRGR